MTHAHHAVIERLSANFAAISHQLATVSADLVELDRVLAGQPGATYGPHYAAPPAPPYPPHPAPPPALYPPPYPPVRYPPSYPPPPVAARPPMQPPAAPRAERPPRADGWIGKVLAIAGVAVTLIGVVLLLVLAAQAGILRPEIRVAAGAVLAGALVAAGGWLYGRPGGRVGAIALAATGTAAGYMDVIAVTTIYGWISAPVGLAAAALIGGGGLTLARRWHSEQLALLVLVPLIALAPVVTGGITVLLVGFMLALSAASLLVTPGRDWIWMYAARIAAGTLPLLAALATAYVGRDTAAWLAGACGVAALLALGSALVALPHTSHRVAMALLSAAGVTPVLCASTAVGRLAAALMAAALASALLSIALIGDRLPGVGGPVRQIWSALSAVSALIAVVVAFDGHVAGPVLLAMAVVVAVAARGDDVARWAAVGFAAVGGGFYLAYAPPHTLVRATELGTSAAVSTLISSVLLIAGAGVVIWVWDRDDTAVWAGSALVIGYAVTTFAVTAGVLIGGAGGGFFAGHMAATICWIAVAAALFGYAARVSRRDRRLPIGGGLTLVAAATAKLFLFDLGTLDGIFRVAVFIVVGLVLLGMGAGYARLLDKQDQHHEDAAV